MSAFPPSAMIESWNSTASSRSGCARPVNGMVWGSTKTDPDDVEARQHRGLGQAGLLEQRRRRRVEPFEVAREEHDARRIAVAPGDRYVPPADQHPGTAITRGEGGSPYSSSTSADRRASR